MFLFQTYSQKMSKKNKQEIIRETKLADKTFLEENRQEFIALKGVLKNLGDGAFSEENRPKFVTPVAYILSKNNQLKKFEEKARTILLNQNEMEHVAEKTFDALARMKKTGVSELGECLATAICNEIGTKMGYDFSKMSVKEIESKLYKGAMTDLRQVSLDVMVSSLTILAGFEKTANRSFDQAQFNNAVTQLIAYVRSNALIEDERKNRAETTEFIEKQKKNEFRK